MQDMLAAIIITNMSGISQTKANPIGRMFPLLFTINLPEEDQIFEDLEDIEGMQIIIIMYHMCSLHLKRLLPHIVLF